jgi:hypothetical protein
MKIIGERRESNQGNNNLSTVLRTQNILWEIIPNKKIPPKVYHTFHLKNHERRNPAKIVTATSSTAISKNLYLCIPVFGFPIISLYLHKSTIYTFVIQYNIVFVSFKKGGEKTSEKRRKNKNYKNDFLKRR